MNRYRVVIILDTEQSWEDLNRKMGILAGKLGDVSELTSSLIDPSTRGRNCDLVLSYLKHCRTKGDFYRTQAQIGRAVGLGAPAVHRALKKLRFQVETDGNRGWRVMTP